MQNSVRRCNTVSGQQEVNMLQTGARRLMKNSTEVKEKNSTDMNKHKNKKCKYGNMKTTKQTSMHKKNSMKSYWSL